MNTVQSEAGNKDALIERLIGSLISRVRAAWHNNKWIYDYSACRTTEARIFVVGGRGRASILERSRRVLLYKLTVIRFYRMTRATLSRAAYEIIIG